MDTLFFDRSKQSFKLIYAIFDIECGFLDVAYEIFALLCDLDVFGFSQSEAVLCLTEFCEVSI